MPNRVFNIIINPLLRTSWKTVLKLWKPIAIWTGLVYICFTALLAPLFVSLLNRGVFRGERTMVGNEELLSFLLSPVGFSYLFLALLILITGVVIRYAGIFQIVTDDLLGRDLSIRGIIVHIAPRIHLLVKLCALSIVAAILLLLPLAAGLGIVYYTFLTEFDINYYLFTTPPEWYSALAWGGTWAALWLLFALFCITAILPVLPAYLDGRNTLMQSIRDLFFTPLYRKVQLLKAVIMAIVIWIIFRFLFEAINFAVFHFLAGWAYGAFESLRVLAFIAGNYLVIAFAGGIIISFFGFSLLAVILTKFYYSYALPEVEFEIPGLKKITHKMILILGWWTKPVRLAFIILVMISGGFISSILFAGMADDDPPEILNIAHRANALGAPENSIAALKNSIEIGADMAEIDLQMTADGRIVILHDADLMRVAGDPRRIADVPYDEIRDLRLLTDLDIPDEYLVIPTFEDFLEIAKGEIILLTELKYYGFYPELAEETIRLIREYEMEEQVPLMSLSTRAVNQVRELTPEIEVGYVSALAAGDLAAMPVNFFAISHQSIDSGFIRETTNNNQPVYAWTVNRADDMINAMQRGATGLITDEPVLAEVMIEQFSELTRAERLLLQFGLFVVEDIE